MQRLFPVDNLDYSGLSPRPEPARERPALRLPLPAPRRPAPAAPPDEPERGVFVHDLDGDDDDAMSSGVVIIDLA